MHQLITDATKRLQTLGYTNVSISITGQNASISYSNPNPEDFYSSPEMANSINNAEFIAYVENYVGIVKDELEKQL